MAHPAFNCQLGSGDLVPLAGVGTALSLEHGWDCISCGSNSILAANFGTWRALFRRGWQGGINRSRLVLWSSKSSRKARKQLLLDYDSGSPPSRAAPQALEHVVESAGGVAALCHGIVDVRIAACLERRRRRHRRRRRYKVQHYTF